MGKLKQIDYINNVKVLMMLSVVLCHASAIYTGTDWGNISPKSESFFFASLSQWLGTFHVQSFTFCAGYIFYFNFYLKKKYDNITEFISNRAHRLLIPYIFCALFWVIPGQGLIYSEEINLNTLIKNFLLGINPAQLWFCIMLFGEYILFYFLAKIINKRIEIVIFVSVLVLWIVRIMTIELFPLGVFQIGNIMKYSLYFGLGMIVCKHDKRITKNLLAASITLIASICLFHLDVNSDLSYIQSEVIMAACSISGIWFSLCLGKMLVRISDNKLWRLILECSMGIYLLHQQLLYIVLRCFNNTLDLPVYVVLCSWTSVVLISVIISHFLRKYKYGRLIIGG